MIEKPMIERAARAMARSIGELQRMGNPKQYEASMWPAYVPHVRAVMEAMRKPTEGMYKAAWDDEVSCSYTESAHTWDAMIAAALAE